MRRAPVEGALSISRGRDDTQYIILAHKLASLLEEIEDDPASIAEVEQELALKAGELKFLRICHDALDVFRARDFELQIRTVKQAEIDFGALEFDDRYHIGTTMKGGRRSGTIAGL